MLKIFMLFLGTLILANYAWGQEQETKVRQELNRNERTDALKVNLLSPFYGTINLAWQHKISNDASFHLTLTYMDFDSYGSINNSDGLTGQNNHGFPNAYNIYEDVESQVTRGATVTPEYRFVLNGKGFSGVYIAPFARYMYYEYERNVTTRIDTGSYYYSSVNSFTFKDTELYAYHSLGLGVIVGKQFVFKNRVLLDFFGGPVYTVLLASNKSINKTGDVVIGTGIPNTYVRGYGIRAGFSLGFLF